MSERLPDVRAAIEKVMTEWGLHQNETAAGELHSWRCQHFDIYGPCECLPNLIDDLVIELSVVVSVPSGVSEG